MENFKDERNDSLLRMKNPNRGKYIGVIYAISILTIGVIIKVYSLTLNKANPNIKPSDVEFQSFLIIILVPAICWLIYSIVGAKTVTSTDVSIKFHIQGHLIVSTLIFAFCCSIFNLVSIRQVLFIAKDMKPLYEILHFLLFCFAYLQVYFFFTFSECHLAANKWNRIMLMHLISVNFNVWFSVLANEVGHSMQDNEDKKNITEPNKAKKSEINITEEVFIASTEHMKHLIYPFLSEYSLVAIGILLSFWHQMIVISDEEAKASRKFSAQLIFKNFLHSLTSNKNVSQVTENTSSKLDEINGKNQPSKLTWRNATGGFFLGLILVSILFALTLCFDFFFNDSKITFFDETPSSYSDLHLIKRILLAYIFTRTSCKLLVSVLSIIGIHFLSRIQPHLNVSSSKETLMDKVLIILSLIGVICLNIFGIIALSQVKKQSFFQDNIALIGYGIDSVLGFLHSVIQSYFTLKGLEYEHSEECLKSDNNQRISWRNRPLPKKAEAIRAAFYIRQCSAILCVLNMGLWVIYTYELRRPYFNLPCHMNFSTLPWNLALVLMSPLIVLYRFQTAMCFFTITIQFSDMPWPENS